MIAWRAISLKAMFCAESFDAHAISRAWRIRSGKSMAHCMACIPPKTAAEDRGECSNAEGVGEHGLGSHPVLDRHGGERRPVRVPGCGIDGTRSGAAVTAAEVVQTDDEAAVRVDGLAGAYAHVPPTGFVVLHAVIAGRVMVSGQGVADQNSVRFVGVERSVGLVDDLEIRQPDTALQIDRTETRGFGNNHADRVGRQRFHVGLSLILRWRGLTGRPRKAS